MIRVKVTSNKSQQTKTRLNVYYLGWTLVWEIYNINTNAIYLTQMYSYRLYQPWDCLFDSVINVHISIFLACMFPSFIAFIITLLLLDYQIINWNNSCELPIFVLFQLHIIKPVLVYISITSFVFFFCIIWKLFNPHDISDTWYFPQLKKTQILSSITLSTVYFC